MRIVSLVPSGTEILWALGLGDAVVGVTHECDFPPEAAERARVTHDVLPAGLSAGAIDAAVRERTEAGESIYALDEDALRELRPDLIVTQALCAVCAVSYEDVRALAARMQAGGNPIRVLSLDPHTLGEVMGDIRTVAWATEHPDAGAAVVQDAADRIERVERAVAGRRRPRVAVLEWLDPVFVAGHWTPQLVELAGGEDILGAAGEHSRVVTWEEVALHGPDVVVVAPCGYDAERSRQEAGGHVDDLRRIGAGEVVAVDAAAYFSRPGPRLVEGLELLAHILHPDVVPAPPPGAEALTVEL